MRASPADLAELTVQEKIQLATEIWDTIAESPEEIPVTAETRELLRKRWAELEASPHGVAEWKAVRAKIQTGD